MSETFRDRLREGLRSYSQRSKMSASEHSVVLTLGEFVEAVNEHINDRCIEGVLVRLEQGPPRLGARCHGRPAGLSHSIYAKSSLGQCLILRTFTDADRYRVAVEIPDQNDTVCLSEADLAKTLIEVIRNPWFHYRLTSLQEATPK